MHGVTFSFALNFLDLTTFLRQILGKIYSSDFLTKDGDNLKVSVSVKYLDNKSKMTQISQYELVLHKNDNCKIVE